MVMQDNDQGCYSFAMFWFLCSILSFTLVQLMWQHTISLLENLFFISWCYSMLQFLLQPQLDHGVVTKKTVAAEISLLAAAWIKGLINQVVSQC